MSRLRTVTKWGAIGLFNLFFVGLCVFSFGLLLYYLVPHRAMNYQLSALVAILGLGCIPFTRRKSDRWGMGVFILPHAVIAVWGLLL